MVANFQRLAAKTLNAALLVSYGWGTQCPDKTFRDIQGVIEEYLSFGDGTAPFIAPAPFDLVQYDNPIYQFMADPATAQTDLAPGWTGGAFIDQYSPVTINKPYSRASYTVTQQYVFRGPCTYNQRVVIGGPYTITRSISQDSSGNWVYICSKDGDSTGPILLP